MMLPHVAKGNLAMNRAKNVIIGVFIAYLCFRSLVRYGLVSAWASYIRAGLRDFPLLAVMYGLVSRFALVFIVGFLLRLCASSLRQTRTRLPKDVQKSHIGSGHQERQERIAGWLFLVASPDYWLADTFKRCLCPEQRRRFLQEYNWLNIAASLVILMGLDLLDSWALLGGAVLVIVKSFLVYHLISIVIEMTVGFYQDAVADTERRYTGLRSGERISLAIHSYFDIIALYAAVYFAVLPRLLPCRLRSPIGAFLYSYSVSSFIFSLPSRGDPISSLVVLTQMFASLNLVVLSVTVYITTKEEGRPFGGA